MVLAKSRNGRKLNKALKISNPKVALENRIRLSISHNVQGLALLGYLKNVSRQLKPNIRLVAIVFTVRTSDMGIDVLKCCPTYVSATENHCKMVYFQ